MNGRIDTSSELRGAEVEDAWKHMKPLLADNKEQQVLEYLAKLPDIDPTSPRNPYYLLGEMYFSLGRNDDAKRALLTARGLSPNDAHLAAYLGMVQLASGEIDVAEQSLRSALTLDAADPLALIGMGGIRYRQERWLDSITYLERSRTADPNTLLLLCDAYFRVGKKEDALLTAEVIRAFGADQRSLLDSLDQTAEALPVERSTFRTLVRTYVVIPRPARLSHHERPDAAFPLPEGGGASSCFSTTWVSAVTMVCSKPMPK